MIRIGLIGRAWSGKTAAAEAIRDWCQEAAGLSCEIFDIGERIIRHCVATGAFPDKKKSELTKVELRTVVDTGWQMRLADEDYWIKQVGSDMGDADPQVAIVPNIRYRNEAEWLRRQGGVLVKVTCLNYDGSERIAADRNPNHPSETELASFNADFYITAKVGESALVDDLAITLFEHIRGIYG